MLPLIRAAAPLIGKIFGLAAGGASDERYRENNQRLVAAQNANSDALARAGLTSNYNLNGANLDLARKQFQQNEPNAQANQALRGSLMSRIQPLQMSGLSARVQQSMPHMNSIIDAIGPEARAAGGALAQRGLSGLQSGPTQFNALPALNLPPAQIAALQKSGLLEKILGSLGMAGSAVGAFQGLGKPTSGNGLPIDPTGGG